MEPAVNLSRSTALRAVFAVLGFAFLGVGIAGWFVPGLPGTVNLLIALYFFSMSSERMHRWMLTNRYFGKTLRDYKGGYGIPRAIKIVAVTAIVASVTYAAGWAIDNVYIRLLVVAVGIYGVWFVLTRPTTEVVRRREALAAGGVERYRAAAPVAQYAKKPR